MGGYNISTKYHYIQRQKHLESSRFFSLPSEIYSSADQNFPQLPVSAQAVSKSRESPAATAKKKKKTRIRSLSRLCSQIYSTFMLRLHTAFRWWWHLELRGGRDEDLEVASKRKQIRQKIVTDSLSRLRTSADSRGRSEWSSPRKALEAIHLIRFLGEWQRCNQREREREGKK